MITDSVTSSLADLGLSTGTLLVAVSVLFLMYNWPVWDRHLYPPGPLPLPFVGFTLWMARQRDSDKALYNLRDKYGDVITLDLMRGKKLVYLNSAEAFWEGFIKHAHHTRKWNLKESFFAPIGVSGGGLILQDDDELWKPTRRHMQTVFKEHGIGTGEMESLIQEEISYLHKAIDKQNSEPFDIHDLLTQATCNIITTVSMNQRFDYSDERIKNMQLAEFIGAQFLARVMPIIKYLPFDLAGYTRAIDKANRGVQFVLNQISQHKKEIVYENNPRDFIDSYLIKMKDHKSDPHTVFNDQNLKGDVVSMYAAGTDTSSESLYWAIAYMVVYPDIQERIYTEIKQMLGMNSPSYTDRHLLPYTMAVLTEIMRVSPVFTGTASYECIQDIDILGHKIPAGTLLAGNKWPVFKNEDLYPQPDVFRPERFIDSDGKLIVPEKKLLPSFGLGPRRCPGELLGRTEVFMFLTSIIQKYSLVSGQAETPSLCGRKKFVMSCPNYLIRATPRLDNDEKF